MSTLERNLPIASHEIINGILLSDASGLCMQYVELLTPWASITQVMESISIGSLR